METLLEIKNICKTYKDKKALINFNLTLNNGVYGLVGPNGAGKTTLINTIVGLISPNEGEIIYNHKPIYSQIDEYLSGIGYLPQYPHFYDEFKCIDFLYYMSELKGLKKDIIESKVDELLELCNLIQDKNRKIKTFSGGMKQRLGIAQALLNDPKILILDEPTAGLDPKERMRFRNIISQLSTNRIVILATHILEDVESIANEVILMKNGQILKVLPTENLLSEVKDQTWEITIDDSMFREFEKSHTITRVLSENGKYCIRYIGTCEEGSQKTAPRLEEVYMYYFG